MVTYANQFRPIRSWLDAESMQPLAALTDTKQVVNR